MWSYCLETFWNVFFIQQIPAIAEHAQWCIMESFTKSPVFQHDIFFFPQFCLLVQVVQVLCRTRWGMASSDLECWFRGFDGHRRGVFSTAWSSAVKAEGEQFGRWTWTCPKAIPKGSRIIFQPSIVRCYVYVSFREGNSYRWLAGGFKYFACSSLFWEMIQFE